MDWEASFRIKESGDLDMTFAEFVELYEEDVRPKLKNSTWIPTCRVIAHDKSSLAPEGESIAFRLDKDNGFSWEGVIDISVDELLRGDSKVTKVALAKDFLSNMLSDGSKPSTEIFEAAEVEGIGKRTLYTAKDELKVKSFKVGEKWHWKIK